MKQNQLIIGALAIAGILMTGWLTFTSDPAPVLGKSAGVTPSTSNANTTGEKKTFVDALSSWGRDTRTVINGINVPPMPDAKLNNATIAGVDTDNNGIRDDIDRLIAEKFGNDPKRYQATVGFSKNLQAVLVNQNNKTLVSESWDRLGCFGSAMLKEMDKIERVFVNTKERSRAYGMAFAGTGGNKDCPRAQWIQ